MSDLEKVSVNFGAMDLAHIDLLVDNGFYKDRTDFLRTAARNLTQTHSEFIDNTLKSYATIDKVDIPYSDVVLEIAVGKAVFEVGRMTITKKQLNKEKSSKGKLKIVAVGSLTIEDDVDLNLAINTISFIKVFGIFKAPSAIKEYYAKQKKE